MPSGLCSGCGRITNSALSNWWSSVDSKGSKKEPGIPTECYVAAGDGVWEKGCALDSVEAPYDEMFRKMVGKPVIYPKDLPVPE